MLRKFITYFTILFIYSGIAIAEDDINVNATLISQYNQIEPSSEFNMALKIQLKDSWYTYYKNGGDVGLGPDLTISTNLASDKITIGELEFPAPMVDSSLDLVSYIYKNEVILPFKVSVNDIKENVLNVNAKLNILVCKNVCIPLDFNLNKQIKIGNSFIDSNFFKYSKISKIKNSEFFLDNNKLYLKLNTANAFNDGIRLVPNNEGVINDIAPIKIIEQSSTSLTLEIEQDAYLDDQAIADGFKGIIVLDKPYSFNAINNDFNMSLGYKAILLTILLSILGGIILNLMPCVLPVIGLKVYSIMNSKSKKERIKGAFIYFMGVLTSMLVIAGILLILKSLGNNIAWGFQLQNKYFVYFMIALLSVVGLSLFGAFNFGNGLANKALKLNNKYSGDFFTGVLTTFVATPCSAPFMATSLGFALSSNSTLLIILSFSSLAFGISLPIILISFSNKLQKLLPKPGAWSEKLKQFLAYPIFATVIWLIWVLLEKSNSIIITSLLVIFTLSLIIWLLNLKTKLKFVFITIFILLTGYIINTYSKQEVPKYIAFNKAEIAKLNAQGTNVFVDFTAKWCITCQFNKKTVLHTNYSQNLFNSNGIVFMTADWTNKNDYITKEIISLKRSGVPVYAIYKANGDITLLPEILTINILKNNIDSLTKESK